MDTFRCVPCSINLPGNQMTEHVVTQKHNDNWTTAGKPTRCVFGVSMELRTPDEIRAECDLLADIEKRQMRVSWELFHTSATHICVLCNVLLTGAELDSHLTTKSHATLLDLAKTDTKMIYSRHTDCNYCKDYMNNCVTAYEENRLKKNLWHFGGLEVIGLDFKDSNKINALFGPMNKTNGDSAIKIDKSYSYSDANADTKNTIIDIMNEHDNDESNRVPRSWDPRPSSMTQAEKDALDASIVEKELIDQIIKLSSEEVDQTFKSDINIAIIASLDEEQERIRKFYEEQVAKHVDLPNYEKFASDSDYEFDTEYDFGVDEDDTDVDTEIHDSLKYDNIEDE